MSRFSGDEWADAVSETIECAAPDAWATMTREQRATIAAGIGREAEAHIEHSGHWPETPGFKDRELAEARAEIKRLEREVDRLRRFEPKSEPQTSWTEFGRMLRRAIDSANDIMAGREAAARKGGGK